MKPANHGVDSERLVESNSAQGFLGSKTKRYIDGLRKFLIEPAERTELKESCFATALPVFAGIEGLGTLLGTPKNRKRNRTRFLAGVREMKFSGQIKKHANALWKLRCSLSHTASNVGWELTKLDERECDHLQRNADDSMLLHTPTLVAEFRAAVDALEEEIQQGTRSLQILNERIEGKPWCCLEADPTTTTSTCTSPGADLNPMEWNKRKGAQNHP